jgi:hypothetical protein
VQANIILMQAAAEFGLQITPGFAGEVHFEQGIDTGLYGLG